MTDFGPWTLTQDGPLAVLTVASPPLNLWDEAVQEGLYAAVDTLAAQPPRGLLIRAEGRAWTGGVDVHLFDGLTPETGGALWARGLAMVQQVEDLPCPTVFAAHALCLTWGLELALACDLLVAAEGAKFGLVETVVGLTPSLGGPQRLAERVGAARARELIMTGDLYTGETLAAWGAVNAVLPKEGFDEAARAYAMRLAAGPTVAHAATKRIIRTQQAQGARAADAIVPEVSGALFATEDLKGAVRSFLEQGPGHATYAGR